MEKNILIDIIGWVGVVAILIAYIMVSTKKLEGNSAPYQVLNLIGGVLLMVSSAYYGAFPSVGVNVVWVITAVVILNRGRNPTATK